MKPVTWEIHRGTIAQLTLVFTSNDDPLDVSGWTFSGQLRKTIDSAAVAAVVSSDFVTDGTDGAVRFFIPSATTAALDVDPLPPTVECGEELYTVYFGDVKVDRGDGEPLFLFPICAHVSRMVTHA